MAYTYEYPRPALAVDCVVFGIQADSLHVLLIERAQAPFLGWWALPGGFVQMGESLDEAARRELREETGLSEVYLEQLYTFGEPDRDPRERVVSVAYYALVKPGEQQVRPAADARRAQWFPTSRLPTLAFDHEKIVRTAIERLRGKVRYRPVGFELLPRKFTLAQLQRLYETLLERPLDKRNFRRKVQEVLVARGVVEELPEFQTGVRHRRARLYRFDRARYRQLEKQGFDFEL